MSVPIPPPTNIEDGTTRRATRSFLNAIRLPTCSAILRAATGRDLEVTLLYTGADLFGAFSEYWRQQIGDGAKALSPRALRQHPILMNSGVLVGQGFPDLPISTPDLHWLVGVNGTHVIKPADAVANGGATLQPSTGRDGGRMPLRCPDPAGIDGRSQRHRARHNRRASGQPCLAMGCGNGGQLGPFLP